MCVRTLTCLTTLPNGNLKQTNKQPKKLSRKRRVRAVQIGVDGLLRKQTQTNIGTTT